MLNGEDVIALLLGVAGHVFEGFTLSKSWNPPPAPPEGRGDGLLLLLFVLISHLFFYCLYYLVPTPFGRGLGGRY